MKAVHFLSGDRSDGPERSGPLIVATACANAAGIGRLLRPVGWSTRAPRNGARVRAQVASPGGFAHAETDRFQVIGKLDRVERELVGRISLCAARLGEGGRELLVVERRLARAVFGVDQDEFALAAAQVVAIPETVVLVKPVRGDAGFEDEGVAGAGRGAGRACCGGEYQGSPGGGSNRPGSSAAGAAAG